MRNGFLIGRFLKAYTSAYRYKADRRPPKPNFDQQMLEKRFSQRARRFREQRGRYTIHLQAAFAVALLLVISAFQLRIYAPETEPLMLMEQELVTMEEIIQTQQLVKPPPPPRPPVPVEVPNDEIIEADDLDLDATLDITEPLAALPPPPPVPEEEEEEEPDFSDEIFVVVEQMPEMIGGWEALMKDLKYPPLARQAGLEGMVVVKVVIDETGRPLNPEVAKSVHEILDQAAIEAVLEQRFEPGRQRNRPVRVAMAIPVRFQLTTTS